jgi:KaiC/GvpD/RAD55 family RecA-like ATPase
VLKVVKTGIAGLNELLSGGFPEGRITLLIGGPGTGKTIFAGQFIHKGIKEFNQNGIYISLDENKKKFFAEMGTFGWEFIKTEKENKFVFIDATKMSRHALARRDAFGEKPTLRRKQLPIDKLIDELETKIREIHAKRVAIDTLATLFQRFPDPIERRVAIVDLFESLSELEITTIITMELPHISLDRAVSVEEYLADGVLVMQTLFSNGVTSRALQVEKMRGVKINPNLVPYTIDKNGIEVYPDLKLFGKR